MPQRTRAERAAYMRDWRARHKKPRIAVEERFWRKVNKTSTCWLWTGTCPLGYGQFTIRAGIKVKAHRFAYEALIGPIPDGMELDHLCRVKNCVNPGHLEPVTAQENIRRGVPFRASRLKTQCVNGHPYTEETTSWWHGRRHCRVCHRISESNRRKRLAA